MSLVFVCLHNGISMLLHMISIMDKKRRIIWIVQSFQRCMSCIWCACRAVMACWSKRGENGLHAHTKSINKIGLETQSGVWSRVSMLVIIRVRCVGWPLVNRMVVCDGGTSVGTSMWSLWVNRMILFVASVGYPFVNGPFNPMWGTSVGTGCTGSWWYHMCTWWWVVWDHHMCTAKSRSSGRNLGSINGVRMRFGALHKMPPHVYCKYSHAWW